VFALRALMRVFYFPDQTSKLTSFWAWVRKDFIPLEDGFFFRGFVGAQGVDSGLIIQIPKKPLDTNPFDITCRASQVSLEASRGATGTKVL